MDFNDHLYAIIGKFSAFLFLVLLLKLLNDWRALPISKQILQCMQERRYKDGLTYLNKLLALWPPPEWPSLKWKRFRSTAYYYRAYCYMQQEEYKLANADFTTAISLAPTSAIAYMYRGDSLFKLGRLDEALKDLNMAVTLATDCPTPEIDQVEFGKAVPLLYRARLHQQMGRADLAAQDRQFALDITSDEIIDKKLKQ